MNTAPSAVPLQEGMELLGLDKSGFYYYVNARQIKSYPDVSPALYDYQDILKVREKRQQKLEKRLQKRKPVKPKALVKPATFGSAASQDMPEIGEVLKTHFSKINTERRVAWIERNPDICFVLRSEGSIVGCAFVMPMDEQKILQILHAQVKPPTRPADIAIYEPGKHYSLYVRSFVVLQSVPKIQRRYWAARLIAGVIREIVNLGARGMIIDKIYAQTDSIHVAHLLKVIGFTQLVSPTGNMNFVLDVSASGSVYAVQYKQALNVWLEE